MNDNIMVYRSPEISKEVLPEIRTVDTQWDFPFKFEPKFHG